MRLTLVGITALIITAVAWASGGDLLWIDQTDGAAGFDTAIAVATSADRSFTAGLVTTSLGDTDFVVRANDLATGSLLWQDVFDLAGSNDSATSISTANGIVFAGGSAVNALADLDFSVRAYDGATGALLWQDLVDGGGGIDVALATGSSVGRFFAAGFVTGAFGNRDFIIRAYEAKTGLLLWSQRIDFFGFRDQATLGTMAVSGGRVFVGGIGTTSAGNEDFLLLSFDMQTGTLLWKDLFDSGGFDAAKAITARSGKVYVAGYQADPSNYTRFLLRAYDGASGALLWEDHSESAAPGYDFASSIVVSNNRIFAAGFGTSLAGRQIYLVRAYASASGHLLWEDAVEKGGSFDYATSIAIQRDKVFVAGSGGLGCGSYPVSNCGMLLRAYDGPSGRLLWEDPADMPFGDDLAKAMTVQGGRLIAVGYATNQAGDQDIFVRAVDTE